jgi:phage repressor protein C with HTH and peptisase S24 domain
MVHRSKSAYPEPGNLIGRRLKYEMKSRGISSVELARRSDVKTSFIYDVISGKSANPSTVKLARVAEGLGISLASLVRCDMQADGGAPADKKTAQARHGSDYIAIPYLTIEGQHAGAVPAERNSSQPFCFLSDWIGRQLRLSARNLRVFIVNGDSMDPTLLHHDVVLVDVENTNPTQPGIFVLFDGYGLVVKRVERILNSAAPRIRILSDNPQYSIYEKLPAEAGIVGRVVWFSRSI